MESKQVAETILQQLGGNKFRAMTGATGFCHGINEKTKNPYVSFKVGSRKANYVSIELTANDDYNMLFVYAGMKVYRVVKEVEGVYADMLQNVFTQYTGLYTRF